MAPHDEPTLSIERSQNSCCHTMAAWLGWWLLGAPAPKSSCYCSDQTAITNVPHEVIKGAASQAATCRTDIRVRLSQNGHELAQRHGLAPGKRIRVRALLMRVSDGEEVQREGVAHSANWWCRSCAESEIKGVLKRHGAVKEVQLEKEITMNTTDFNFYLINSVKNDKELYRVRIQCVTPGLEHLFVDTGPFKIQARKDGNRALLEKIKKHADEHDRALPDNHKQVVLKCGDDHDAAITTLELPPFAKKPRSVSGTVPEVQKLLKELDNFKFRHNEQLRMQEEAVQTKIAELKASLNELAAQQQLQAETPPANRGKRRRPPPPPPTAQTEGPSMLPWPSPLPELDMHSTPPPSPPGSSLRSTGGGSMWDDLVKEMDDSVHGDVRNGWIDDYTDAELFTYPDAELAGVQRLVPTPELETMVKNRSLAAECSNDEDEDDTLPMRSPPSNSSSAPAAAGGADPKYRSLGMAEDDSDDDDDDEPPLRDADDSDSEPRGGESCERQLAAACTHVSALLRDAELAQQAMDEAQMTAQLHELTHANAMLAGLRLK